MSQKYNYICIDGSNLLWRHYSTTAEKYITIERYRIFNVAIGSLLGKLKRFKTEFGYDDTIFYIIFDNPFSAINLRKIISDGKYKHARQNKQAKNVHMTMNLLEEVLKSYSSNYRVMRGEHLEADDLTLPLKNYLNPTVRKKLLFISADFDWARNIDKNSHWYNYKTIYDVNTFKKKHGFSPTNNSVKIYKAIRGDYSDCIPNAVPYLPKKILLDIINDFDNIEDLFSRLEKQTFPKHWKEKIKESKSQILLNYKLVDFVEVSKPIKDSIIKCKENILLLKYWFTKLKLPYEVRLIDKKDMKKEFFSKKSYKKGK